MQSSSDIFLGWSQRPCRETLARSIAIALPFDDAPARPINDVCAMSAFPPDRDQIAALRQVTWRAKPGDIPMVAVTCTAN